MFVCFSSLFSLLSSLFSAFMPTTLRTYLEMRSPPTEPAGAPPSGAALEPQSPCPVPLYRTLYDRVGAPWQWFERRHWSDEALAAHLGQPHVRVVMLTVAGQPAGFYELARHEADDSVEIAYFGLVPDRTGQGLGGWLLRVAILDAWTQAPDRVWLHTCTLDHPAALPNYLKRGFRATRTETVEVTPKPV